MIFIKAGEFLFEYIGAIHTGSAQGSAEPEPSLQCEQGSAWIVSAGLEFLIRAAGYSHLWLSLVSAWNRSLAPSRASEKYPIVPFSQGCRSMNV